MIRQSLIATALYLSANAALALPDGFVFIDDAVPETYFNFMVAD